MIWLARRQFRTQTLAALVLLAPVSLYLLITGTQLRHAYDADLASCRSAGAVESCAGVLSQLQSTYSGPQYLAEFLVMAAPAVVGIFWGAPLIAGELDRGTHFMVWNQSVSRTRWLAVKFTLTAFASVAAVGVLSLLLTWWAGPLDVVLGGRWGTREFNARDIAPLGYAAFAFALGVALGLLIRRTVPAMAATLAIFLAVQVFVTADVRAHLLPTTTLTVPITQTTMSSAIRFDRSEANTGPVHIDLPAPAGAWILSESPALGSDGRPIPTSEILGCWSRMLDSAAPGKGGAIDFAPLGACLAPDDLHVDVVYQPSEHYWPLQWAETALYSVLSALLAAVCFWSIRKLRG